MAMLGGLARGLIDIIYPKTCLACKTNLKDRTAIDDIVCAECWDEIKMNLPPFCSSCGRHIEKPNLAKNICPGCTRIQFHFDRAFSPCVYEGKIRGLIHEFKYKGKDYIGSTLSKLMIEFIKEYGLAIDYIDLIIPVPLSETRLREREFNQAEVLCGNIAREFGKKLSLGSLKRVRHSKAQAELEASERFINVKNSFSLKKDTDLKGKNILLVDDVLTTGATCSEAARVLKEAGCGIVFALTLAN